LALSAAQQATKASGWLTLNWHSLTGNCPLAGGVGRSGPGRRGRGQTGGGRWNHKGRKV